MKRSITIAFASVLLAVSPLSLACVYPKSVELPDGAKASKDAMLTGQSSVKTFMAEMDVYLECIDRETNDALADNPQLTPDERQKRKDVLTEKHNAAVAEMELIAARFNEEVREYKAQSQ